MAARRSGILRGMRRGERQRLIASTVVLLGLVGGWTGHLLEYLRVDGAAGVRAGLLGSAHVYMLPLGGLLALLGALSAAWWWRVWTALGHRLDGARRALAGALRGHLVDPVPPPAAAAPSGAARWIALTLLIAALQVTTYVLQENLEAVAAGTRVPGLGAVVGVHAAAPLVHLAVAALLSALALVGARRLGARTRRLGLCTRLVRVLLATLARAPRPTRRRPAAWHPSPLHHLGRQLWRGPPPARLLAR
jgi:hypothetical protein